MAMTDAASKCLRVLLYYSEKDQENALKLMKYVGKNTDIFCYGPDRTPGKNISQCMEQAIDTADYFILFLSPQLSSFRHLAWIGTIIHKVKQDINNKLTIVLYGMSKDEFTNTQVKKFDLAINDENVIYNPWAEWQTVAKQIFLNLNLKSITEDKRLGT